ncbi:MAG: nucleotidyl transferase AbiEii/AbiGii toxin family protein [Pseudobdellovibrionaceae bacterium]
MELFKLKDKERELYFNEAVHASGIPFIIIEKDYWVVWTLERLFSLSPLNKSLTFKGGTSLSKVYKIIERFSEDIDLSIEKDFWGFTDGKSPEAAKSRKKQNEILEKLSNECSKYVQGNLLRDLTENISNRLQKKSGWKLFIDPNDKDGQTLQFEYPSLGKKDHYIASSIKIELGARSEHWPVSHHSVQSYVKESLENKVVENPIAVRVLNAERTFWEKATILHQYAHIPETKKLPPRISRHFYDFCCLLKSKTKKNAVADLKLLERVAKHKSIYFAATWASYDTAKKGSLKLCPPSRIAKDLEDDFEAMGAMFFGKTYAWKEIIEVIEEFEADFNAI